MPTDIFMKINGIQGESRDKGHKDEIDVLTWTWGLSNQVMAPSAGGGAGAGKVKFQDISFTHLVDKASPNLMLSCASGKHIHEARITVRRSDPTTPQEFLLIKLQDVMVTGVQSSATRGPEGLMEQVTLNFAKVDFEYKAQRPDGALEAGAHFNWDLRLNKP
ncbi:MAG: type VI secretion system tube protein Hcp [Deltaproteobacteria bacterium]|nr:MAG: type VI secretion system tube protein Hcp [Deltaproteobacteria bacterium]